VTHCIPHSIKWSKIREGGSNIKGRGMNFTPLCIKCRFGFYFFLNLFGA